MIYKAEKEDMKNLIDMGLILFEGSTSEVLREEFTQIMENDEEGVFFIAYEDSKTVGYSVGFAQCQLRHDYVEGTETSPVGYLEGIFVKENYRRRGIAKSLLEECEKWAKSKGCKEFASDCLLENTTSLNFHLNIGFTEANRIICFTKKL